MKLTKYITTTNKGNPSESLLIESNHKVTILTSKKTINNETKFYYSYQLSIPLDWLLFLTDNEQDDRKFYLKEINMQHYQIVLSNTPIDNAIMMKFPIDHKKRRILYTLPKKHMQYLKAYDTYQDVTKIINQEIKDDDKKFKISPLSAKITLRTIINEDKLKLDYAMDIEIKTDIDDRFIEYAKKDNANMDGLPSWLETLKIDWEYEMLNEMLNIESNVNKWKY